MLSIALIAGSTLLLCGFLLLTALETRRGVRLFTPLRLSIDRRVERVTFVLSHVDWSEFVRQTSMTVATRIAHDVTHAMLQLVRAAERTLTRTVRFLREAAQPGVTGERPPFYANTVAHVRHLVTRTRDIRKVTIQEFTETTTRGTTDTETK